MKADQLLPEGPPKQSKEQQAESSILLDQRAEGFVASSTYDKNKGARNGREVSVSSSFEEKLTRVGTDTDLSLLSVTAIATHIKHLDIRANKV